MIQTVLSDRRSRNIDIERSGAPLDCADCRRPRARALPSFSSTLGRLTSDGLFLTEKIKASAMKKRTTAGAQNPRRHPSAGKKLGFVATKVANTVARKPPMT